LYSHLAAFVIKIRIEFALNQSTCAFPGAAFATGSGNRVAAYRAGIFLAPSDKSDLVAVQFADQIHLFVSSSHVPGNILKILNEADLAALKIPDSVHFRRNNPEMSDTPGWITSLTPGRENGNPV